MHEAARYGKLEILKYLVLKVANINARDKYGITPFDYALYYQKIEIVQYLASNGADRKKLVRCKYFEYGYCDYRKDCIDVMGLTIENNSFAPIRSITFI